MKLSGKQDVLSPLTLPDSSAFCSLSPSKDVSNGGAPNQLEWHSRIFFNNVVQTAGRNAATILLLFQIEMDKL